MAEVADVGPLKYWVYFKTGSLPRPGPGPAPKMLPAPIAEQRPHKVVFGAVEGENRGTVPFKIQRLRDDPWFWLRDDTREKEEVLDHLRKENAYAAQQTAPVDALKKELYDEHVGHLKETDDAPPYMNGGFFYYSRTVKGLSYKIHCRKAVTGDERLPAADAKEEILLDENKIAEGHKQCVIGSVKPSPDHSKLAYMVDFTGNEVYGLVVLDIESGKELDTAISGCSRSLNWGNNEVLFYVTKDAAKRPYRVWRHKIGREMKDDEKLLEDLDDCFYVGVGKSMSGRFIFAQCGSSETSEFHMLDCEAVDGPLVCIQPRVKGLRYDCEHDGRDGFLITTNKDNAVNNRLMYAPIANPGQEHWVEAIPYDADRQVKYLYAFSNHAVLEGRQGGLTRLWILDIKDGKVDADSLRQMSFDEELYRVGVSVNKVFDTPFVRINYSSLTTPDRWLDYDMNSGAETLIKEKEVLNFDRSNYVCKRIFATASDKTQIPISVVHAKSLGQVGGPDAKPFPTMLYGYGSYGISVDPAFDVRMLPYLDRGMVYVIAHIRGGGEMGRYWYEEQGKYLNKRNTFSDFITCAEHIIEQNIATPERLAIEGRSAGGLLMGNVANMRPDLFKVVVAGVPFVDLMNTMCDPSIPLTTGEWEEWGNPNEPKYHDYMLSYSPYDNVRSQPYPTMLITAGLHDPRVPYWEPAKWAAKIRTMSTSGNDVVVKLDLESGHFSASDRYKYLRDKAFDQSYVLWQLGCVDVKK